MRRPANLSKLRTAASKKVSVRNSQQAVVIQQYGQTLDDALDTYEQEQGWRPDPDKDNVLHIVLVRHGSVAA